MPLNCADPGRRPQPEKTDRLAARHGGAERNEVNDSVHGIAGEATSVNGFGTFAVDLADRGLAVFPCQPQGKKPLSAHGCLDASTDPHQIKAWAALCPNANVGLATGAKSGIVVLDVDPAHNGDYSLAALEAKHGPLPDTVEVLTGGGGRHIYFKHPGFPVKNAVALAGWPGLDIRGDGGYVIGPGSVHPSGARYEWEASSRPDDVAIADMPAWLLAMCQAPASNGHKPAEPIPSVIPKGAQHHTLVSAAGTMHRRRFSRGVMAAALHAMNNTQLEEPAPPEHIEKIVDSVRQYPNSVVGPDGRPFLDAEIVDLAQAVNECWRVLREVNDPPTLLRRSGELVVIGNDDDGRPVLQTLAPDGLRLRIAEVAFVGKVRYDDLTGDRKLVPARLAADTVRAVAAVTHLPVPAVSRIAEVPVYAPDGSLETEPGYHAANRAYYVPPKGFALPPLSEVPSAEELERARGLILEEVLGDFPFASEADRAHAVALLILPFARDMIDGPTPGHMIEAPTPGSGKDLLAESLLIVSTGGHFGVLAETDDDDEWRKRIATALLQGHSVLYCGNLARPVVSGVIAHALTTRVFEDRRLGTNEMISAPVRCVWVFTGNNPTYSTEIARRLVRIRLDPKLDRPWLREGFRHDPLRTWVQEHRGELVWAVLTLVKHWLAEGRPAFSGRALGSFEAWSRVVGGILEAAGIPGFLANLADAYEAADTEGSAWRAFFSAWWETHGDNAVKAAEVLPLALEADGLDVGGKTPSGQVKALGKMLTARRDRIIGEHRIVRSGMEHKTVKWCLQLVETESQGGLGVPGGLSKPASVDPVSSGFGSQQTPLYPQTPPAVGDWCELVNADGTLAYADPLWVLEIAEHDDGRRFARFTHPANGADLWWSLERCGLVIEAAEVASQ